MSPSGEYQTVDQCRISIVVAEMCLIAKLRTLDTRDSGRNSYTLSLRSIHERVSVSDTQNVTQCEIRTSYGVE